MRRSGHQFNSLGVVRNAPAARPYRIYSILLLFSLILVGGTAAANTDVQKVPFSSVGPGQSFTITDFDGDRRPDLATVRTGVSDLSRADYWIQLKLTTTGRQSIRVVARVGGLQIAARDVNGDHAVDLVLTTAFLRQPVAILLNDGHGNFTRVAPAAFPDAFTLSETNWATGSSKVTDAVGVPPQWRAGIYLDKQVPPYPKAQTDFILFSTKVFSLSPFLTSHRGRAPPTQGFRL